MKSCLMKNLTNEKVERFDDVHTYRWTLLVVQSLPRLKTYKPKSNLFTEIFAFQQCKIFSSSSFYTIWEGRVGIMGLNLDFSFLHFLRGRVNFNCHSWRLVHHGLNNVQFPVIMRNFTKYHWTTSHQSHAS